jgi:hypothetical protein
MTIDDALDELGKKEELDKLQKEKREAERELKRAEKEKAMLQQQITEYMQRLAQAESDNAIEKLKSHLRGMSNFWPGEPKDDVDEAVLKLITLPNFLEIYRNALVLKKRVQRHEYLMMECLKNNVCDLRMNNAKFFLRLAPLGMNLACPYFELGAKQDMFNTCSISGSPVGTTCNAQHDICRGFADSTRDFATGEKQYPKHANIYKVPEPGMDELKREQLESRLLEEIEKYWRDD